MKKIITTALAATAMFYLTGCGNATPKPEKIQPCVIGEESAPSWVCSPEAGVKSR